jgi:hypothetical protein
MIGGSALTGTVAPSMGADVPAPGRHSTAKVLTHRPSVRITKRRQIPPWKNPRRFDQATIGKFLIVGKCRELFLRNCLMRFRGTAAKARRAAKAHRKPRAARRWEPVVISPVFPRGPLALPSLGFLQDGLSARDHRQRWARRRRMTLAAVDQNLSSAACSSP